MYTDPRVVAFVENTFLPVRVHVKQQHDEFQRLGARFAAQWTPTIIVVDPDGTERHRIEGFLPTDDFLSQLELGEAHAMFGRGEYERAEQLFREVIRKYPESDAGPEAQYWAGVSKYRATNDAGALAETAQAFGERYQNTSWAKKASVWA